MKIKLIDGPCEGEIINVEYQHDGMFDVVRVEPCVFDYEGSLVYDSELVRHRYRIEFVFDKIFGRYFP